MSDKNEMYPTRVRVLDIPVDPFTMQQSVSKADEYLRKGEFAHLIGVNADKVLQVRSSPSARQHLERCELINADGASMVMAARWLGSPVPERVSGIDLMSELCELAESREYSVYLLGARPHIVEAAALSLQATFPQLRIVGYRDGYFGEDEYSSVATTLQAVSPSIVFVGITSPKKEELIETFRSLGLKAVFVGVGGSFDVVSGVIPRAPLWMQKIQCEWLFRLAQEPRRLFKRYLGGNTKFLSLLVRERFSRGKVR